MKLADAKGSSIIFLCISTLGRKSCLGKMDRVWDGKAPDLGQVKEGAVQRNHPEPRAVGAESAVGTTEGTMGCPSQAWGRRQCGWGGCQSPPLQRGVPMLGCTGDTEPHPAPAMRWGRGKERGWDLSAEPPTAASSPVFPHGNSGPHSSSDDRAKTPRASSTPRPRGTPTVGLSKLLNPCYSSTQRPPPGPGFLRARRPRGMLAVRLSPMRQLWHSAAMQISASSTASARRGVAGCATARVYVHPAAHQPAGSDPARTACTGAQLGKEGLQPYLGSGQLSNVKHGTSPASAHPAAPAPRERVLPARQSWDGLASGSVAPSLPVLPSG